MIFRFSVALLSKLFEGNRKATTRRSMKISVFFYASMLDQKAKNARRPMGGSIGDLRASSASFTAMNKILERRILYVSS